MSLHHSSLNDCKLSILFILISCNCVIINHAKSEESPGLTTSTPYTTTSIEPTTTSAERTKPTRAYASSSSSSSIEDQLTPLLLGSSNGGANGDSQYACVTCPQTVCTLSKVSYERKTIHHNWRVDGLPDYITYLEKFQAPFGMTSNVRFNATPPNDGNWTFTLSRKGFGISTFTTQDYEKNHPLELAVTYRLKTDTRAPPRLSFDLWLSAHMEDEYVTLPSQISSHPSLSNTELMAIQEHSNDDDPFVLGAESSRINVKYIWTYLFLWSDIQSQLASLIESVQESQSVVFKFVINSYQEGLASTADANCHNWNGSEANGNGGSGSSSNSALFGHHHHKNQQGNLYEPNPVNNATWPPFLHHMYVIMKDDKYTDLTVKSGDEEFQIHRVIAAFSSPVLATMIFNKTYDKSESLLDFGEDIGSDVVEELIRYMYTGRAEDIEEIADRLIIAATTYGFPALKRQCESVLIKQVKTENAFNMYELGAEVGSMRLKRRAFNVMKENKSKIVAQSEEFRKLSVHHPDVMYELFLS